MDDLGEACVFALERWDPANPEAPRDLAGEPLTFLNVGTGVDLTIRQLAEAVAEATGYRGEILLGCQQTRWHSPKATGCESSVLIGWQASIPLAEGLSRTVALFREHLQQDLARL